jgi:DNA-binding XRE family transcriptional regulator
MKIFHFGEGAPAPLTATGFIPMPPDRPLPGYLCQAARALLNVSQAWLWQRAKVSRKTINDFENGYAVPKIALNLRMKRALEHAGAQFIHGEDMVGVVVYAAKPVADR